MELVGSRYNHVALGLFLWAVHLFQTGGMYLGAVLFVLAVNFKQMELYHSLPIFVLLLSRCIPSKATRQSVAARALARWVVDFVNSIKSL